MATRTVRLDDKEEEALGSIREATGLPISEVLKRGLRAFQARVLQESERTPYRVYEGLDLGPGGYALAPSTESRRGVRLALARKRRG
jgi:hypothetical protein